MLKKYFYISILLGVFALSGCIDDKVDTTNTEEEAPILLNLTQEQKENYYNQYLEILEDIRVEYPSANMEIKPLDEYEHWIEPEELRERVIDFLKNGVVYYNNDL